MKFKLSKKKAIFKTPVCRCAYLRRDRQAITLTHMKKHGFEIKINDETICRAGLDVAYYVVSCNLVSMMRKNDEQEEISIHVGALNAVNNNHLLWTNNLLKSGDRISIEIIDSTFDEPAEITLAESEEFVLQQKIKYFHRLKEELKGHLDE